MINQEKWDKRFLEMAKLTSTWSKDISTKVGAVITDSKNRVISIGFNGLPQGIEDSNKILEDRELKYRMILHAEENAIHFSNQDLTDCTIYTYPMPPCIKCSSSIIQKGIKRVVSVRNSNERWVSEFEKSKEMFDQAGIELILYDTSNNIICDNCC